MGTRGLPWDDPDSDPLGDLQDWLKEYDDVMPHCCFAGCDICPRCRQCRKVRLCRCGSGGCTTTLPFEIEPKEEDDPDNLDYTDLPF